MTTGRLVDIPVPAVQPCLRTRNHFYMQSSMFSASASEQKLMIASPCKEQKKRTTQLYWRAVSWQGRPSTEAATTIFYPGSLLVAVSCVLQVFKDSYVALRCLRWYRLPSHVLQGSMRSVTLPAVVWTPKSRKLFEIGVYNVSFVRDSGVQ